VQFYSYETILSLAHNEPNWNSELKEQGSLVNKATIHCNPIKYLRNKAKFNIKLPYIEVNECPRTSYVCQLYLLRMYW